ncbi:hypothetical protein ACOSQ2_010029 [Xanthoceras sorbifolium]
MSHKSKVFNVFKKLKVMVKYETGLKIKQLRYDNKGEYKDSGFKKLCYDSRIKMVKTLIGILQQNGISEQMNITLTKRAKNMCIQLGLSKQFEQRQSTKQNI